MPADGAKIIDRLRKLEGESGNHRDRWQRMAPFIAPSRVGSVQEQSKGESQTRGVYDSTTLSAAELHAMFIAGHSINPAQRWFDYNMRDAAANRVDSIREWLEECRDITLKRCSSSLFYAEGPESLVDYGGFGTGFLLCEESPQPPNRTLRGFRGFYFIAQKTGTFWIQDGADGLVDTAFRRFPLSARVAIARWGRANMPEKVLAAANEGKQDTEFKFVHAIYPRELGEQGYGGRGMPWASCWVEEDSKKLVSESGYRKFPAAVPRYHRTPGEVFGRGRGDIAFPDTWTLNTAKRMGLEDWALKIRPPVLHSHQSVMGGTLRLTPGGPTPINTQGRDIRQSIMPFETGSHPEVSNINEENLRKTIRQIFYVDQILMLLEVQKSEMTAFEFAKKIELLFRLLGPVYGRMEWEYLYRIVDIMFDLQFNAGGFPPPPPEIYQTDGKIDVQFHNPIAKAQRSGDAESLMLALNDLQPLVGLFPDILDRLDPQLTADGIFDLRGVPAKWLRSDEELAQFRAAKAQQHQQELAMANAQQAAETIGKAGPGVKALSEARGGGTSPAPSGMLALPQTASSVGASVNGAGGAGGAG